MKYYESGSAITFFEQVLLFFSFIFLFLPFFNKLRAIYWRVALQKTIINYKQS
jgi:hypothetical protein